jgi:hypothetical protein
MHADGTEERTKDRSGPAVPMLAVFHLAGADLDIRSPHVVRLHLLDEGVDLALDPAEGLPRPSVTCRLTSSSRGALSIGFQL